MTFLIKAPSLLLLPFYEITSLSSSPTFLLPVFNHFPILVSSLLIALSISIILKQRAQLRAREPLLNICICN